MADVFFSYSRADSGFVRRLHDALAASGKDVWVDWQDIPPSADWFQEVYAGIEAADAFVFVISPDSAASDICGREIAHAAELSKRIIPILHREVDPHALPAAITRPNWIVSRTEEEFEPAAQALVAALATDLDWVQSHTRWLMDARRWEERSRDPSMLLRGTELDAAERWLTRPEAEQPDPPPAPLHYEYILASRAAATRRQRLTVSVVSVGLVIALASAVFALVQRNSAITQQRSALSRALAANAFLNLAADPELSLMLSSRAARVQASSEAAEAMRQALIDSRVRATMQGHREGVTGARFSPDGRLVLTSSVDKTARIWDAVSGRGRAVLRGHQFPVHQASFSPDGARVLTVAQDGTARVWDTGSGRQRVLLRDRADHRLQDAEFSPDGKLIATSNFVHGPVRLWSAASGRLVRSLPQTTVHQVVFSPDGRSLLTLGQDGTARIWDVDRRGPPSVLRGHAEGFVHDGVFSPRGDLVVTSGADGTVRSWDPSTGSSVAVMRGSGAPVTHLAFAKSGSRVLTGGRDGTASIWDPRSGRRLADLSGHSAQVNGVAFSPDDSLAVTASDDQTARVWDPSTGRTVAELKGHKGPVTTVAFSRRGDRVVTASYDRTARVWSPAPDNAAFPRVASRRGEDGAMAFSANDRFLVTTGFAEVGGGNVATITAAGTGRTVASFSSPSMSAVPGVSGDGRLLVTQDQEGRGAQVQEAATGRVVGRLPERGLIQAIAFSPDNRRVALATNSGIASVWDVDSGRRIAGLTGHKRVDDTPCCRGRNLLVNSVEFSADGQEVITSSDDGTARLWDADSGRSLRVFRGHPPPVHPMESGSSASFSPDGTRVVGTAGWNDTALVWDRSTGRQLAELEGHAGAVQDATFSPDSQLVVTASYDGTARIWDATSARALGVLRSSARPPQGEDPAPVQAVAFGEGGRTVIAAGQRVDIFRCEICGSLEDLTQVASRRITRALTPAEQAKYLG